MPCRGNKDLETVPVEKQQEQTTTERVSDIGQVNDEADSMKGHQLKPVENNDITDNERIKNKAETIATAKKKAKGKSTQKNKKNVLINDDSGIAETAAADAGDSLEPEEDAGNNNINNIEKSIDANEKKRNGWLCCGSSSIEVRDSLRPLEPDQKSVTNDAKTASDGAEFDENENDENVDEDDENYSASFDDKENEMNEMNFQPSTKKRSKKKKKVNQGYVDDEPQGKMSKPLGLSSKKGKYSVHQSEDDPLYASIENRSPVKAGKKKKSSPKKLPTPQFSRENDQEENKVTEAEGEGSNKKKRAKKPKLGETDEALEMQSVYESQIASLQNNPTLQTERYSGTDFSATGQPTIEIEKDLLDNADEERKKNKQRLRERKLREKEQESLLKVNADPTAQAYENAQKEIDRVLGPREKKSSKSKRRDGDKSKAKEKKKDDETDEDSDEKTVEKDKPPENLEEARQRMHKLLDDAFSLFSQSRSSMGNKVHPSPRESSDEKGSPSSQRSQASRSSKDSAKELASPQPEEKKHTPIIVQRSHGPYDNSGLISWSPYRASDETALISLPNTQTDLGAVPPQREVITTSTFSESLPSSLRPNYYTTLPGEPIVIKMEDLEKKSASEPEKNQMQHNDTFSEPYYGMSSYHEIPRQSEIPNMESNGSAKHEGAGHIDVRMHSAPGRGENQNNDVLDVIKQSVQPGASPEPLISSLRDELQSLSMKKKATDTANLNLDKSYKK